MIYLKIKAAYQMQIYNPVWNNPVFEGLRLNSTNTKIVNCMRISFYVLIFFYQR